MSTITREPVTHNLKIWPEYFAAVREGLKRAELRWNDREYQAGDILDLCEWDPNEEAFTGDLISVTVTHVADLGQWMPGYVLLSVAQPAPVSVPDDVSGPLAHAYKELTPTFMRNHIDVFERYGIYPDGSAGIQAMRIALDGMTRRAAMLQGADGTLTNEGTKKSDDSVSVFGIGSVFKPQKVSVDEVDCDNCAHYQPNVCHGEGCPAAMLQSAEQTNYRAIVERIAEIIHGKVTDIDLLTVTVKSMKDKLQK
ncbi:DUF3850 domain-containing protein [Enterobacter cloacae complex sp.6722787]|uniref:DUF3850 domain-containing protein n=1 Tax=unclassified Enterobacter cloacae complex TaxID=2757714 RepID=UPI003AADAF8A